MSIGSSDAINSNNSSPDEDEDDDEDDDEFSHGKYKCLLNVGKTNKFRNNLSYVTIFSVIYN